MPYGVRFKGFHYRDSFHLSLLKRVNKYANMTLLMIAGCRLAHLVVNSIVNAWIRTLSKIHTERRRESHESRRTKALLFRRACNAFCASVPSMRR